MKRKLLLFLLLGLTVNAFSQLTTPAITAPAIGTNYYVGSTINFTWTSVPGALSYDVEFDAGLGYAFLTNASGTGLNMVLAASNVGPHTWHVRAKDANSNGSWSSSGSYQVTGIPSSPATTSPATDTNIQYDVAASFTWSSVANATGYKIQFDSDPVISVSGNTYTQSFTTLGNHSWKVLASNPAGVSDWSAAKTFVVVLGTPSLTSPANATNFYVGSMISFSWSSIAGATSYDVEMDAGLGYATLTNVPGASMNLLISNGQVGPHTWHIRARSGSFAGSWSASRNYTVIGLPSVPTTTTPVSGSTIYYQVSTNFSWNQVQNATSYQIQFDSDAPIPVTGTTYAGIFSAFGSHSWKVQAINQAGASDWSSLKDFTLTLAVPNLSSPNNNTLGYINTSVTFSWAPVPGATSYDIEFDAGQGSATTINVAATSLPVALAAANIGNHTWHVRGKNGPTIGQWSQSRNYSVVGLPAIPTLGNPANESVIPYGVSTNFTWNNIQNATGYQIQFDSEPPMTIAGATYPRTFADLGSHTWRVKATNPAGESDWSAARSFTVSLGTPALSSPTNAAAFFVGSTINFSWTAVTGATTYDIELDAGMGFASLINVATTSFALPLAVTSTGPHTWHVRAKLNAAAGPWSASRSFTVTGSPDQPVTVNPASGAIILYDAATNFTWNAVANASSYQIQFDNDPPIIVSGTNYTRSFTVLGDHTWKVKAINSAGSSDWSSPKSLTVTLGVPNLNSPANAATFYVGSAITLSWTSVTGATSYDVELDAGLGYVTLTNTAGTNLTIQLVASMAGPHTWHVRAKNSPTVGQWSSSRSYTVIGIPEIPTLLTPANGSSIFTQVATNFTWSPAANATGYLIQFDSESPVVVSGTGYSRTFGSAGIHTWKVQATNAAGSSDWSQANTFSVVLGIPTLITPADAAVFLIGSTISFSWTPMAGATSYDLEIDAGTLQVTLNNLSGSSMDLPVTATNVGIHNWHARAKYGSSTGSWSATRTYTVLGKPAAPVLVSPANGSIVYANIAANFIWRSVPTVTNYQIQFDNEASASLSDTTTLKTFTVQGNHTWKVKALNAAGESDWSAVGSFIVSLGSPNLPSKILLVAPDNSWDYGNVSMGNTNEKTFVVQNTGNSVLNLSVISLSGTNSDQFAIKNSPGANISLTPGGKQEVTIQFKPTSTGLKSTFLTIGNNSDNASPSKIIALNGTGSVQTTKTLATDPDGTLDFGNSTLNYGIEKSITLQNNGTAILNISGLYLTGTNPDQFTITSSVGTGFDLPAGGIQLVKIRFRPGSVGFKSAVLQIANNSDNASPLKQLTLTGTGVLQSTRILTVVPDEFSDYGIVPVNGKVDKIFSLQNNGSATMTVSGLSLTGTNQEQFSIVSPSFTTFDLPAGGIQQVTIRFSPISDGWKSAIFTITNNSDNASVSKAVTLNGTGTLLPSKILAVTPDYFWDYGNVLLNNGNDKIFTLQNNGSAALSIVGLTITGPNSDQFSITAPTLTTFDIPAGGVQQISIRFKPVAEGWKSAFLSIVNSSDNAAPSKLITLNGTGVVQLAPTAPSATTSSATAITSVSAFSGGNVTSDGGISVTARGVCWSKSTNPTIFDSKTSDGTGTGSFSSTILGLSPGTTYWVRAYATNAVGTSYGENSSFTTLALPSVATSAVTVISSTAATGGGNVSNDGGAPVTAKGICWSINTTPVTSDLKTADGTGTGTFGSSLGGLSPGVTYHARAYATNSVGTAYGSEVTFTTWTLSTVTTVSATATVNPSTTATGRGNVTSDGGSFVTEKGLCWGTIINPTVSDSKSSDGSGLGAFSDILTGLIPGTTYHVRAFSTNGVGTSYGADVSFITSVNGGIYDVSSFYQIYPNPSAGRITIKSATEVPVELSIYTTDGHLLGINNLTMQSTTLDLGLKKGVYLLVLKSIKGYGSYRLIIM